MQSILNFFADNLVTWLIIFGCTVGLAITMNIAEGRKPPEQHESRESKLAFIRVTLVMSTSFLVLFAAALIRFVRWIW